MYLLPTETRLSRSTPLAYLYRHGFGLDNVNLISVATPHLVMDYSHAADGVVWPPQIQQVVVGQIPLTVLKTQKNRVKKLNCYNKPYLFNKQKKFEIPHGSKTKEVLYSSDVECDTLTRASVENC